ncbi:MAG: hypothetical protein ACPGNT_09470 [Rhodospirillales bacterium]
MPHPLFHHRTRRNLALGLASLAVAVAVAALSLAAPDGQLAFPFS